MTSKETVLQMVENPYIDEIFLKTFDLFIITGGGYDLPEAYEMVLKEARTKLSWTPGSKRSLVMIGDSRPHEPNSPMNRYGVDWRQQVLELANMVTQTHHNCYNKRLCFLY